MVGQRRFIAAALAFTMAVLSAHHPAVAAERGVTIQSFAFAPGRLTVNAGDTVTWTNRDGATHTTTATDRAWDYTLPPGQSAAVTFARPGDFAYFCALHSYMTGTITVIANGDVPSAPATPASGAASATARYVITVGGDPPTPFPRVMIDAGGASGGAASEGLVAVGVLLGLAFAGAVAGVWVLRRAHAR